MYGSAPIYPVKTARISLALSSSVSGVTRTRNASGDSGYTSFQTVLTAARQASSFSAVMRMTPKVYRVQTPSGSKEAGILLRMTVTGRMPSLSFSWANE